MIPACAHVCIPPVYKIPPLPTNHAPKRTTQSRIIPGKKKVAKSPKDERKKLKKFKSKRLKRNKRKKTPLKTKTAQPIQTKETYYGQMCVYPPLFPSGNDKKERKGQFCLL